MIDPPKKFLVSTSNETVVQKLFYTNYGSFNLCKSL